MRSAAAPGPWFEAIEPRLLMAVPAGALVVTEIMFNPAEPTAQETNAGFIDNNDFEFLELQNVSAETINLNGVSFVNGFTFSFSDVDLDPSQFIVLVKNPAAFDFRYDVAGSGIIVGGQYVGALANNGERIRIKDDLDTILLDFTFDDAWYPLADGGGFSLVLIDPGSDPATWSGAAAWRPSTFANGSPGSDEAGIAPGAIVINEILSHTDLGVGDWIELHNTTSDDVDIGGWFLSDDPAVPKKYRIADGTTVPANGYTAFTQLMHFGVTSGDPGVIEGFAFSEFGDDAQLTSAQGDTLTGYRRHVSFGAAQVEVTFGRYVKSTGGADFTAMTSPTFNQANTGPLIGSVVINEIMYNPAGAGDEFIEIINRDAGTALLYDPQNTQNAWQFTDGVVFTFPPTQTLGPGARALIVPADPAAFRLAHNVPMSVAVYGPYAGALANDGEAVDLSKPGDPEITGFVPYIVVDHVRYNDKSPWPTQADGDGASLSRLAPGQYGNDPINWIPGPLGGTPGRDGKSLDIDGNAVADALSDAIIIARHLSAITGDPLVIDAADPAGTRDNPNDAANYLHHVQGAVFDVDADGMLDPATDGVLIARYLFGFTGLELTSNALGAGATRTDPAQIIAFLDAFNPNLFAGGAAPTPQPAAAMPMTWRPTTTPTPPAATPTRIESFIPAIRPVRYSWQLTKPDE